MLRQYCQLAIMLLPGICYADNQVYQSVDKNGNMVIGNTPGGQVVQLPSLTIIPAQQMQTPLSSKELKRRQILEQELDNEQKALKDVENLLQQSIKMKSSDKTQLQVLQDAINEHKKNIAILKKQLNN